MKSIEEKAASMLQRCETVNLASVSMEGYPRPVPMARISSKGFSTVWLTTGKDSLKVKHFLENPKAGLSYFENGNSVVLTGDVEVITDLETKKQFWIDWFIEYFPNGFEDTNYCLLKFKATYATFWIDKEFIHKEVKEV